MAKPPAKSTTGRDSLKKLRADVVRIDQRLTRASKATKASIKAVQDAYEALSLRGGGEAQDELRGYVNRLAATLEDRLAQARTDVAATLANGLSDPRLDKVAAAVQSAQSQLSSAEIHQAESISKINGHIARLASALDARLQAQAREQDAIKADLTARIDQGHNRLDKRITEVEGQSAEAIMTIGERVATLSNALNTRLDETEKNAQERIYEMAVDSQHDIESQKAEIARRLDAIEEGQRNSIMPVQHSLATVFSRLEALESGMVNVITPAARGAVPPFPAAPEASEETPKEAAQNEIEPAPLSQTPATPYMPDAFSPPPAPLLATPVAPPANPYAAPAQDSAQIHQFEGNTAYAATPQYDNPYGNPYEAQSATPADMQNYAAQAFDAPAAPPPFQGQPASAPPHSAAQYGEAAPMELHDAADTMDMARPGVDGAKSKSGLNPRLLRTAAMAAGLVVVVSAGAFMLKGKLGDKQPATTIAATTKPAAAVTAPSNATPQYDVTLTAPTGNMSQPEMSPAAAPVPSGESYETLMAAVEAGDPIAQMQHGVTLLRAGKADEGANYVRKSASQGLTAAQYVLGHLYDTGEGVKADKALAKDLTQKAAQGGHRVAMYDLAVYYVDEAETASANGQSAEAQAAMGRAVQWFRKAGAFGMTDAQFNVAVLYDQGNGTPSDPAEAHYWYSIAGQAGDQESAARAQQIAKELPADMLQRSNARVAQYKPADFDLAANGIFPNVSWEKKVSVNKQRVVQVQTLLTNIGYDIGGIDGAPGPKTRDAIKDFERANGLPETGQISDPLVERLVIASQA